MTARFPVYAALLSHVGTEKYFVVVSNHRRNRHLDQVLAVHITATPKPPTPSIVELGASGVVSGREPRFLWAMGDFA